MVVWGLRITTFITNLAVIVAFGVLYTWLQHAHPDDAKFCKWRPWLQIGALWTILIIFHFASVWGRAEAVTPVGYGWNYLNFQAAAIVYSILGGRNRKLLWSLIILMTLWYHFLAGVSLAAWAPLALLTIATLVIGNHYSDIISEHLFWYGPYTLAFVAPTMYANFHSVGSNHAGWWWQFGTLTVTVVVLGWLYSTLMSRRRRDAQLLEEGQIDDLTKLFNFRMFDADLHAAYRRMLNSGEQVALFTFDIDHFKRINDKYGHLVGNTVLLAVAELVQELTAETDYPAKAYRTGGEEFSILMFGVHADFDRAAAFAQHIKDEMARLPFSTEDGQTFGITISLGEDHTQPDDQNYLDVYNRADKYLYDSKNHGRNSITVVGRTLE